MSFHVQVCRKNYCYWYLPYRRQFLYRSIFAWIDVCRFCKIKKLCYSMVSNENNEEILWFIHSSFSNFVMTSSIPIVNSFGIRNTSLRTVKISSPKDIKLRSRNPYKKSNKKYTSKTKTGKNQINNIKQLQNKKISKTLFHISFINWNLFALAVIE